MTNKRTYNNCRHWIYSCPQTNNEYMMKTQPWNGPPPGPTLTTYDIEKINELCAICPKYEKK